MNMHPVCTRSGKHPRAGKMQIWLLSTSRDLPSTGTNTHSEGQCLCVRQRFFWQNNLESI
jgi:hypothetical protein